MEENFWHWIVSQQNSTYFTNSINRVRRESRVAVVPEIDTVIPQDNLRQFVKNDLKTF